MTNFLVHPRDQLRGSVVINANMRWATGYIANMTTGHHTQFGFGAPDWEPALSGNCAEWIVEAPAEDSKETDLAAHDGVTFHDCIARFNGTGTSPGKVDRDDPGLVIGNDINLERDGRRISQGNIAANGVID